MWDDRVLVHTQSNMYDLGSFKSGRNSLTSIELDDIGDISGKKILHLQCHFGQDSLSMARMGAEVTGVDFSEKAIDFAKNMNAELRLNAQFIQSDVYELKDKLNQKFDLVFTSFGVIGWLPDLNKWADIINHFLKPGGKFYLAEFHPFIWTLDHQNDFRFHYPYFNINVIKETAEGTYANENADLIHTNYSWNHPIADVLNPLIKHGFKLIEFKEYDYSPFNVFPDMFEFEEKKFRIKKFGNNIPYVYSLIFEKEIFTKS
jgi:SAM-dependent methyltransferase